GAGAASRTWRGLGHCSAAGERARQALLSCVRAADAARRRPRLLMLAPELIHAGEGLGVGFLERCPIVQRAGPSIIREACLEPRPRRVEKAGEAQIAAREELAQLRKRQAMLLDVQGQIAEAAQRIDVANAADVAGGIELAENAGAEAAQGGIGATRPGIVR